MKEHLVNLETIGRIYNVRVFVVTAWLRSINENVVIKTDVGRVRFYGSAKVVQDKQSDLLDFVLGIFRKRTPDTEFQKGDGPVLNYDRFKQMLAEKKEAHAGGAHRRIHISSKYEWCGLLEEPIIYEARKYVDGSQSLFYWGGSGWVFVDCARGGALPQLEFSEKVLKNYGVTL